MNSLNLLKILASYDLNKHGLINIGPKKNQFVVDFLGSLNTCVKWFNIVNYLTKRIGLVSRGFDIISYTNSVILEAF